MSKTRTIVPAGGISHVQGRTDLPLVDVTLPEFLNKAVERHGDRMAAVFCQAGERWTYKQLARRVDRLAAGLLSIGLYKGDRIGIWAPNRPEWLIAQFATARIGLVLVNINPAYKSSELEYALNKVEAKALILASKFKTSDYTGSLLDIAPEIPNSVPGRLRAKRLPNLRNIVLLGADTLSGAFSFDEVMKKGNRAVQSRLDAISSSLSPHDAINVQFTSGTTGAPKGATLSHYNIVNNAIGCARTMKLTATDGLCIPVPLYHCFGMVLGNLSAMACGATMVFPSEGFDPLATLTALESENCTAVHGVPTMFSAMLDHPEFDQFDLAAMRTGIMAGSPCPEPLMRRVMRDMGCNEITIAYGMTETSPVSFQTAVDDPIHLKVGTVGRIQPHCEVKIIDAEGKTAPVGETGELLTRGYLVMAGYWNDPDITKESIIDGWMHTGDLATLDDEGYCRIVGRIKDMLIRGGENIYPAEVEEFLLTHPGISEVQVFGVPDPKYGEEVAVWIVARDESLGEQALKDYCEGKIAHFKIPRYVKFVREMPITATGKPRKFIMRDMMVEELSLSK